MGNYRLFKCRVCGEPFRSAAEKFYHIKSEHGNKRQYNLLDNLEEDIRSQGRDLVKMQKRHEANVTMFNYIQKMLKDAKIPKEEKHAD